MNKKIIITGVTGQDGSYMADYLLENTDFNIYGVARRSSKPDYSNLNDALKNPRFKLVVGDLSDSQSIDKIVSDIKPDYFINFAAQSFVKSSWDVPEQTMDINATGTLRCLEAIVRHAPNCRFYNAGSSEEFGDVQYNPQDEKHPLRARSPYGASKVAARQIVKSYRESFNLYAIQGYLFNHECLTAKTPIIVKNINTGKIDIIPISELVPHRKDPTKGKRYTTIAPCEYVVWDGNRWANILTRTATWNDSCNDKNVLRVCARGGLYEATADHISFKDGGIETATKDLTIGNKLSLKSFPNESPNNIMSLEEAEFLGLMVSDGYINDKQGRFTNKDNNLCDKVKFLWEKISVGYTSEYKSTSGFTGEKSITNINLIGDSRLSRYLKSQIYTEDGEKRIPQRILNASDEIIIAFLSGYNLGDGLQSGKQKTLFKSFTTNSYCLASGLWFLLNRLDFVVTSCPEERGGFLYFHLNINSKSSGNKGKHLIKDKKDITKISALQYDGWLFDLETDSSTFSAGIGLTWVHNSPRRGEEFVTRKITKGVARIKYAIDNNLSFEPIILGNLDAKRDWSHAKDFVDGIWRMLNQELYRNDLQPELYQEGIYNKDCVNRLKEYVLSSNETHTIKEFIELAFKYAGIEGIWIGDKENEKFVLPNYINDISSVNNQVLISVSSEFFRPAEVELLLGDSSLARAELKWLPKYSFNDLVKEMMENDIKTYKA